MPLTKTGRKVLKEYIKQYGEEKGTQYFYSSINKGVKGSEKWHKKNASYNRKVSELTK